MCGGTGKVSEAVTGTPTAPRLVTEEDVRWAYRELRGDEPPEAEMPAILRRCRSLLELRQFVLESHGFKGPVRQRLCGSRKPEAQDVLWAYRLLRFANLAPAEAQGIARETESVLALVDGLLEDPADAQAVASALPRAGDTQVIYAKSMPRSGHHLLMEMLLAYFGRDLAYCEFYGSGCCRAMPCQRAYYPLLGNRFFIQKSHDLDFRDPIYPDALYIIQYREPIARIQSNWDHYLHVRQDQEDTPEAFRRFALAETRYHIRFWKKWLDQPPPRSVVLTYESLVRAPAEAISLVVALIDPSAKLDEIAMQRAVPLLDRPAPSSLQRAASFSPRDVTVFRHQPPELFPEIERRIAMTSASHLTSRQGNGGDPGSGSVRESVGSHAETTTDR